MLIEAWSNWRITTAATVHRIPTTSHSHHIRETFDHGTLVRGDSRHFFSFP